MDEKLFRKAMSMFATGITVVSLYDNNEPKGMTVNAFMSVSLDPALVAVSIAEGASMFDSFLETESFGVSMLREDQLDVSQIFARQKEGEVTFHDVKGVPVLKDSLATVSCHVYKKVEAGDHVIFIGEVTAINVAEDEPIIYFGSKYRTLDKLE